MGTIPKLAGKTSGIGYPTFHETCMNVRVASNSPVLSITKKANIPVEPEIFDPTNTSVIKWPVMQGPAPPAEIVSLWQQAALLVMVQREWADNAVSNTLYFKPKWKLFKHYQDITDLPNLNRYIKSLKIGNFKKGDIDKLTRNNVVLENAKYKAVLFWEKWPMRNCNNIQLKLYQFDPNHEEDVIEPVLAFIAPVIKSASLLPHMATGVYKQMPQQGISKEEYELGLSQIKPIDWSEFGGSDGDVEADKFCVGETCSILPK